jgi:hypothetical protein
LKIDIFNHVFPRSFFDKYIATGGRDIGKRVANVPVGVDLDFRFKVMDEFEGCGR